MRKITNLMMLLLLAMLAACDDGETYAEQKEKETNAIQSFLKRDIHVRDRDGKEVCHVGTIKVITEKQFEEQGYTTNLSRNEYVLFQNSGVYMQIVREGVGEKLQDGQTARVICQFVEFNILGDSIQLRSDANVWAARPDIIKISNFLGSFTANLDTDTNGGGPMYYRYQNTSVPKGWLIPFSYIRIGRQTEENTDGSKGIAKVRLIVPHTEGQKEASSQVYPCFYELMFQKMRD